MAENKKSVILYCDIISTFESLEDSEAGRLIKHYLRYINDLNPEPPDRITQLLFEPIKQQLKRDLIKWNQVKEIKKVAGHLGGLKSAATRRSKSKQKQANEADASKSQANEAVNVNVNVNVTEEYNKLYNIQKNIIEKFSEIKKIKNQLTLEQAAKLEKNFAPEILNEVLDSMENYVGLSKKYSSVYLTINKWCKNHLKYIKNGTNNSTSKSSEPKIGRIPVSSIERFINTRSIPDDYEPGDFDGIRIGPIVPKPKG